MSNHTSSQAVAAPAAARNRFRISLCAAALAAGAAIAALAGHGAQTRAEPPAQPVLVHTDGATWNDIVHVSPYAATWNGIKISPNGSSWN